MAEPLVSAARAAAPARGGRSRPMALGLVLFVAVVGSISTALWLAAARAAEAPTELLSAGVLLALLLCVALTSLNLGLRWFRWHFLIRRFTRRILTRDSVAVYLATLPAIVTPFFVGELVRVLILRRRAGARTAHLAWVWGIERALDAAVLLVFALCTVSVPLGLGLLAAVAGLCCLLFRFLLAERGPADALGLASVALLTTLAAWALPVLALDATLALCAGARTPLGVAAEAFSVGTLSGGATGFPLGVSVTGSTMIAELVAAGVAAGPAILSVLVYRSGTAWYAVCLGVAAFVFWRRRLGAIMRGDRGDHFDEIAHGYPELLPEHVRERLLSRKTAHIEDELRRLGVAPGARGLDVGCGQGWYLGELARAGHAMCGVDPSARQLDAAAAYLEATGAPRRGRLVRADACALPFPDASFDFAYSVNAFHHLPSPEAQVRALREIARVLRPGGAFLLHEMNTLNPVFRLYVGYLYPLVREIDEGTEHWLVPTALPAVPGASWSSEVRYFTFLPDFVPGPLQRPLARVEEALERSRLRRFSAHYQARLTKAGAGSA